MPRIATNKIPRIILGTALLATVAVAFLVPRNDNLILPTPNPGEGDEQPGGNVFTPPSESSEEQPAPDDPAYDPQPSNLAVPTTATQYSFVDNLLRDNYTLDSGAVGQHRPKRFF